MNGRNRMLSLLTFLMVWSPVAQADPCGMVPPIWLAGGSPIVRIGVQKTYVFHKNGIETFVIRPGFEGKVDEFGMLIPFPSPPAIRKVADGVFEHLGAAVDPPEVVIDLNERLFLGCCDAEAPRAAKAGRLDFKRSEQEVVVLREEAVGMYEVAVLEAGSAEALKRWMDEHGFRYPEGMDATCNDYVEEGWCFVAVKARVGDKGASDPRPGMRSVDTSLPAGATFDGYVQAMGFRFESEELVLPMRLSTFNEGDLHNVVYVLTDGPQRIQDIDPRFVVRQIPGKRLYDNLTRPLPLRIVGGTYEQVPEWQLQGLDQRRDATQYSGIARELFASDLLSARLGRLAHPHERDEKTLLEIGERLGLRGADLDRLHAQALRTERERVTRAALHDLLGMTLTVVDGDFPREVLASDNLHFEPYSMARAENDAGHYDAKLLGPAPTLGGFTAGGPDTGWLRLALFALGAALALRSLARRRPAARRRVAASVRAVCLIAGMSLMSAPLLAAGTQDSGWVGWIERLAFPIEDHTQVEALVTVGERAVPRLLEEARSGPLTSRGWSIVALAEIGGVEARSALERIGASADDVLVRTWAVAARVRTSETIADLTELSSFSGTLPALERPLRTRWTRMLSDGEGSVSLDRVLFAIARNPILRQSLLPIVLERGPDPLIAVLLGSEDTDVRNLAAACLATLAQQGDDGVAHSVIEALGFDPRAARVPWQGGALFLPGLQWTREDARALAGHLVAWHLWCDLRGRQAEQAQLHNNLRSLGLANAAGYQSPGWNEATTEEWLLAWGRAFGAGELRGVLEAQGVAGQARFRNLLGQLAE